MISTHSQSDPTTDRDSMSYMTTDISNTTRIEQNTVLYDSIINSSYLGYKNTVLDSSAMLYLEYIGAPLIYGVVFILSGIITSFLVHKIRKCMCNSSDQDVTVFMNNVNNQDNSRLAALDQGNIEESFISARSPISFTYSLNALDLEESFIFFYPRHDWWSTKIVITSQSKRTYSF